MEKLTRKQKREQKRELKKQQNDELKISTKLESNKPKQKQKTENKPEEKSIDMAETYDQYIDVYNNLTNEEKQRIDLIKHNIKETIGINELIDKIKQGTSLRAYIGFEPTRSPSLGYIVPLLKIRDLIKAKVDVTILLADLHAYLNKGNNERIHQRTAYYKFLLEKILDRIGINRVSILEDKVEENKVIDKVEDKVEEKEEYDIIDNYDEKLSNKLENSQTIENYTFIQGSDIQLSKGYTLNLMKASTLISINHAKKATAEVIKKESNPRLSTVLYPLMQVIDETALEADIQIGGIDQRKIFTLSRELVEKLGFNKCSYIMTPLIPSLAGGRLKQKAKDASQNIRDEPQNISKNESLNEAQNVDESILPVKMSSSDPTTKIDFYDDLPVIKAKISKAYIVDKDPSCNDSACMALTKYVVFELGKMGKYENYNDFEKDWINGVVTVKEFKEMLAESINDIIAPIRDSIKQNRDVFDAAFAE